MSEVVQTKTVHRITVAYDRHRAVIVVGPNGRASIEWRPRFGVVDVGGEDFVRHFDCRVVLEDVELVRHPGFRDGCADTGVLGFATGRLLPIDYLANAEHADGTFELKFNGLEFFRTDTAEPVTRVRRLLLTPEGKAFAFLPAVIKAASARVGPRQEAWAVPYGLAALAELFADSK